MPVYIRKNVTFTPPSLADAKVEHEDEDDFIQDPDQVRDALPQPYRMLDKCITSIFDRAWDIISNRESERLAEANRLRPPQYECGIKLQDHGKACCLESTPDGLYIIVGLPDGLAVIEASTQHTLCTYQEEKVEITSIQISQMTETIYIISTIDDMGIGRIFGFIGEHIYLVLTIMEGDGGAKGIISKCESSCDGEYLGMCFENTTSHDVWLEMHKLPKDVWMKEIESAHSKESKRETPLQEEGEADDDDIKSQRSMKSGAEETLDEEPTEGVEGKPNDEEATQTMEQPTEESPSSRVGSSTNPGRTAHKFTAANIVLKVKAPQAIQGISWPSPSAASKTVDATGDVIGSGIHHMISTQHLESRNAVFQQMHEPQMQYMPKEYRPPTQYPTFHFVSAGRLMPQGLDDCNPGGHPTAILAWWSGHPQMCFYSLIKPAKDVEHKPDVVWPLSSVPITSTVSTCTSLLAVALDNNNIVVWDKYMGTVRKVHHFISESGSIKQLSFLDPSICSSQEGCVYPPYSVSTSCYLLVLTTQGHMHMINTGLNAQTHPRVVNAGSERRENLFTRVLPINGMPELIVNCHENGTIFIQDVLTCNVLCEVTFPEGFVVPTPWQPVLAVSAGGNMMYIRGHQKMTSRPGSSLFPDAVVTDENDNTAPAPADDERALFVFTLRSFPALDKYRTTQRPQVPFMIHSTVERRVTSLLTERISQQALRKDRMQDRWFRLKDELANIQQMHTEANKQHNISRSAFPQPVH